MAKKKTENIKAAPVLRAQSGGEQPTPTPEQTGTRTYQIMDPWKDRGVVNLVDVKAVDGEITEVKGNGEPAGGGGGSDFSIAKVVITNNSTDEIQIDLAEIIEGGFIGTRITGPIIVGASESGNHKIPLYKGGNRALFMGTAAVTGSISFAEGAITVSGNGTITIS